MDFDHQINALTVIVTGDAYVTGAEVRKQSLELATPKHVGQRFRRDYIDGKGFRQGGQLPLRLCAIQAERKFDHIQLPTGHGLDLKE